jgi:two-component system, cell cycle response regulator
VATGERDALPVLLELTRRLSETATLEAQLQATTDAVLVLVPGDHASLRLFDESRSELLSSARSGTGLTQPPATFRRGEGVVGAVADSGRATLVPNVAADPRFVAFPTQGFEVRSVIATPLIGGGEVIGVLSVSSARIDAFSPENRDLAQLLANCAVPAIEKSRLARLAITDWLTRAYNHRYLAPRLGEEIERARRHDASLSLAALDLDHFKAVNDRHGHDAGDEVLREFAERVRGEVRRHDVLVRRGGEEFILLMPETTGSDAYLVAERIRARVGGQPMPVSGVSDPPTVTVSIGVATWRGETAEALERRADAALYSAKREGRNRVEIDGARPLDPA